MSGVNLELRKPKAGPSRYVRLFARRIVSGNIGKVRRIIDRLSYALDVLAF